MEWKQQTSDNESQTVKDLQKIKDSIHQTILELKEKKKELLIQMEEEKVNNG